MRRVFGLGCLIAAMTFISVNAESKGVDDQPKSLSPSCIAPSPDGFFKPLPPYGHVRLRVSDLSAAKDQINKLVVEKRVPLPEHPSKDVYYFGIEPESFGDFLVQMKTIGKVEIAEQHRSTAANDHLVEVELFFETGTGS